MVTCRLIALAGLITLACVSALDPKAMMGEPPKGLSGLALSALERQGVGGTLYFNCDDSCTVVVNGKEVGSSQGGRAVGVKVKLRPGDVICVLTRNTNGRDGLALAFKSTNGKVSLTSGCHGWHEYVPNDPKVWSNVDDLDTSGLTSCRKGTNDKWKGSVEAASGLICPMSIWGGSGHTTTYILHVVTYAELVERDGKHAGD